MLGKVTLGTFAQRISHSALETPNTAAENLQDRIQRLNTIVQKSVASSDDTLLAVLRLDDEWLRPSHDERVKAREKIRAKFKKCNAKVPTLEALTRLRL